MQTAKMPLIDGFTGTIYIDPDEATINEMTKKKEEIDKQNKLLQQLKGRESVTKTVKRLNFVQISEVFLMSAMF